MTTTATVLKKSATFVAATIKADFGEIAGEWTALCERGPKAEAFSRPEWFRSLAATFEPETMLVTVRRDGELCALLPLVLKRESLHGVPVTKLAAAFNLQSQRFDLIHVDDETQKERIIDALWSELKTHDWNVFETRLTPDDSWLNSLLERAERDGRRTGLWKMDGAPFVTLPSGDDKTKLVEDYFKGLSKNRRKLLSKNLRHLEELGKVEFVHTNGYSKELLDKYFALEAQSWKARAGTDVNSDERIARLHDDFARACADAGTLFVHELKVDGKTIAMYVAIGFDELRTIGWKMSFDEEFARFSPGNVLFKEVLSECMRRGSTELDMLSPETYNKKLFASGTREHSAFYIFGKGIAGNLLHAWKFRVVAQLRELKERRKTAETE